MIAKYSHQASTRTASATTPTATDPFSRQFSKQQSHQAPEISDDDEVCNVPMYKHTWMKSTT